MILGERHATKYNFCSHCFLRPPFLVSNDDMTRNNTNQRKPKSVLHSQALKNQYNHSHAHYLNKANQLNKNLSSERIKEQLIRVRISN